MTKCKKGSLIDWTCVLIYITSHLLCIKRSAAHFINQHSTSEDLIREVSVNFNAHNRCVHSSPGLSPSVLQLQWNIIQISITIGMFQYILHLYYKLQLQNTTQHYLLDSPHDLIKSVTSDLLLLFCDMHVSQTVFK